MSVPRIGLNPDRNEVKQPVLEGCVVHEPKDTGGTAAGLVGLQRIPGETEGRAAAIRCGVNG